MMVRMGRKTCWPLPEEGELPFWSEDTGDEPGYVEEPSEMPLLASPDWMIGRPHGV